jgi:hypothetical protein
MLFHAFHQPVAGINHVNDCLLVIVSKAVLLYIMLNTHVPGLAANVTQCVFTVCCQWVY